MKTKRMIWILLIVAVVVLTTGCLPGDGSYTVDNPAGFFWAIWHGWVAPVSVIIGFFNDTIRIYEVNNTGWPYDFGFYMAIISGFGGLGLARRKKKK